MATQCVPTLSAVSVANARMGSMAMAQSVLRVCMHLRMYGYLCMYVCIYVSLFSYVSMSLCIDYVCMYLCIGSSPKYCGQSVKDRKPITFDYLFSKHPDVVTYEWLCLH